MTITGCLNLKFVTIGRICNLAIVTDFHAVWGSKLPAKCKEFWEISRVSPKPKSLLFSIVMLRAQTHVAGSDSRYGLRLNVTGSDSCCSLNFFSPRNFQTQKTKTSWKIEPARCHWASTVAQNCIRIAFPVMLRAQSHVAGSIFWGNRFFFGGGFQSWASTVSLSQHDECEWARWVWVSTISVSEHCESEWARWVWASNMGSPNLKFHQIWGLQWGTGRKSLRIRNALEVSTCLSYSKSLDHPFS